LNKLFASYKRKILNFGLFVVIFLALFSTFNYINSQQAGKSKSQDKQESRELKSLRVSSKQRKRASKKETPQELTKIQRLAEETTQTPEPAQLPIRKSGVVVAWQPSHQDDTGSPDWHEYLICGDIVDRAIAKAVNVQNVKCWDVNHGLTGSNNYRPNPTNTVAFDSEVEQANKASASYFIAIHNDGGAPSGVLGEYLPGDEDGKKLTAQLVDTICAKTGLPNRGLREVQLYSLEYPRNQAKHKCLLEIGDNGKDREFLEDSQKRDVIAQALAEVANGFE